MKLLMFLTVPRVISEIAEHLGITTRAAQNWVDSASLVWPVVEVEPLREISRRPARRYQLQMKLVKNEDYHG